MTKEEYKEKSTKAIGNIVGKYGKINVLEWLKVLIFIKSFDQDEWKYRTLFYYVKENHA